MGSNRSARDGLYRILRQQRPAVVVAVDQAGKQVNIALREGKGRWDSVVDAAFAMLGTLDRLELRNDKGEVWRTWTPPPDADDDEPEETSRPLERAPATAASAREDEAFRMGIRLSEHVQRACDTAVERHLSATSTILDSLIQVVKAQNERIIQQDRANSGVLKALYESIVAKGEAEVAKLAAMNNQSSPADKLMETMLLGAFAGPEDEPAPVEVVTPAPNGKDPH